VQGNNAPSVGRGTPKPTKDTEWAPWLMAATQRVMTCNALLVKERNHLRGVQVRTHSKKIPISRGVTTTKPNLTHS
jgi:hypothetical protein